MRLHSPFRRLLTICAGTCLIALCAGSTGCVSKEEVIKADGLRELGLSYLNEGKTEDALRELINARDINPRDARIRHELGLAFFAKELYSKAEEELLMAIKLDPQMSEARLNLGSLYIKTERYSDAISALTEVTEDYLYRSPARAYNNLGWAYFKQGQFDESLKAYEQALRIAPRFCQAIYNLALLYEQLEDNERMLRYLEQAVTTCSSDLRYRFKLGVTQAKLGRRDQALSNLELVANKDPVGELGAEAREYLDKLR